MKKINEKNKNIILTAVSVIIFLITLGVIWIMHRTIHFQMDDLWYSTKLYDAENSPPIENIKDIFEAQVWHYFNWGGRSVTHTFLQMTLLAGELFADVLNVIMTVLTGLIIMLISQDLSGTKRGFGRTLAGISIVIGMLHAFNPDWHLNMYWQSGSANYLHITVVILLFIWAYLHALKSVPATGKALEGSSGPAATDRDNKGASVGVQVVYSLIMIPVALFTGWSNENMGPTAFLIAVATVFLIRKRGGKIAFWMIEGAALSLTGSALCILAPGNSVRSAYIEEKGLIAELLGRLFGISRGALVYLFIAFLTAMVLLGVLLIFLKEKAGAEVYLILGSAVISWGAMIMSPHYPERAAYGSMVLLILAIFLMAEKIIKAKKESVILFYTTGAFIWMRGIFLVLEFYAAKNYWI